MTARWPVLLLGLPLLAGCGADPAGPGVDGGEGQERTLTVLAAASLREPFEEIAGQFEEDHPGTTVRLSFGGSSALAAQVAAGAPADVIATADERTLAPAVEAGRVGSPEVFARNRLQLAVPPSNPGDVHGLADLARPGVELALCQPEVPCGALAEAVLADQGLDVEPATLEPDVRAVLAKAELDEVDAGLVYATDVRAAGDRVRGIDLPERAAGTTDYPIAVVEGSAQADLAQQLVDAVRSEDGGRALDEAGFAPAP